MKQALLSLLFIYVTWVLFVAIMHMKQALKAGLLDDQPVTKALCYLTAIIGTAFDFVLNWTIALVLFHDAVTKPLLSGRLNWYVKNMPASNWKRKFAVMAGKVFLNPFDEDHIELTPTP
jgi:hypothetical protein